MKLFIKEKILFVSLLFGGLMLLTQCTKDNESGTPIYFTVDDNGHSQFNGNALQSQLNALPLEDLSEGEKRALTFMREEEKLAHDLYLRMFVTWKLPIFNNIAASEQTHTNAVVLLIERYDLIDPVGSNGAGIYRDSSLQKLYDDLLQIGLTNEIEALKVGATVEEIDILDLENQLNSVVDNQDIRLVFDQLIKGSRNHLRAYIKNLKTHGINYEPQYLSQEKYDEIVNGEMERGI